MLHHLIGLSLGFVALIAATEMSKAQQTSRCAPREIVITRLTGGFGETSRAIGLATNGTLVEIHASEKSGTWSITVTHPSGQTCLLATGNSYESISKDIPNSPGAPT